MTEGYSYDFFVGALTCPACGAVSDADDSTNMQTYLRVEPQMASLGTGDAIEIPEGPEGYLTVKAPRPGEDVRILATWECPSCEAPFNWGRIVVRDGVIHEVAAVDFVRDEFLRAHYVSNECVSIASDLTGRSFSELAGADLVEILKEAL